MDNKRKFARYAIDAKACFKTLGNESKNLEGRVLDIGSLGWGAFFKENIELDTMIEFDLIPNFLNEHLVGSGKIVHMLPHKIGSINGFRVGVEFIEVDKNIVLRIINEKIRLDALEHNRKMEEVRKRGSVGPF